MEDTAAGFGPFSSVSAIPGCIGAIEGWLCPIRVARSKNVVVLQLLFLAIVNATVSIYKRRVMKRLNALDKKVEYRLFPTVHVSKLKLVKAYPDRPAATLANAGMDLVDFDESLLPEDN
ncbi:hypothetical protein PC111_g21536 [Phytophthora cactorum]|nr:hypothetical protein PC111_g21536 [Phytophthora cactorum]